MCDDEGINLSGYYTSFYKSGEINESGKITCNHKNGEWLYFYKSGRIKKYEKYDSIDLLNSNPNVGYLNGTYLEYHPNGNIKTISSYRLIEENVSYDVFNFESYKAEKNVVNGFLNLLR